MDDITYLKELNVALLEALQIVAKNLTQDDGIDPEAWWLELTNDEATMIREITSRVNAPATAHPCLPYDFPKHNPDNYCIHGWPKAYLCRRCAYGEGKGAT